MAIGSRRKRGKKLKKQARVSDSMFLHADSKVGLLHSFFSCEVGRQA